MSEEDQLSEAVQTVIDRHPRRTEIQPAWVATEAMKIIKFPHTLHPVGYTGCHLTLRQLARSKLRRQFDPTAVADEDVMFDDGGDLFPDTLQDRYPKRHSKKQPPTYVRRAFMTLDDVEFNVKRMRGVGGALFRHADALEAWGKDHFGKTA